MIPRKYHNHRPRHREQETPNTDKNTIQVKHPVSLPKRYRLPSQKGHQDLCTSQNNDQTHKNTQQSDNNNSTKALKRRPPRGGGGGT